MTATSLRRRRPRFTYRGTVIRIIGAGNWRRGKKLYEARAKIHK